MGLKEAAQNMVRAWEALPGPRNYTISETQAWIVDELKPAIDKLREALREGSGGGFATEDSDFNAD